VIPIAEIMTKMTPAWMIGLSCGLCFFTAAVFFVAFAMGKIGKNNNVNYRIREFGKESQVPIPMRSNWSDSCAVETALKRIVN